MLRVRRCRLIEAGLVYDAEIVPASVAAVWQSRRRGNGLQQVESTERVLDHHVPEPVVAAGPDQPHVAALHLVGAELHAVVHVLEVVFVSCWKRIGRTTRDHRLVTNFTWLRSTA